MLNGKDFALGRFAVINNQAMGCINNPPTKRKLAAGQEVIAQTSSSQFAKNNHKISIEQRLPPSKTEPEISPQTDNRATHQSEQPKAEGAAPQDPPASLPPESPEPAQEQLEASPPAAAAAEDEQSFQSVKEYFAGLCIHGGTEAEVFEKLGRKRIEIPIT